MSNRMPAIITIGGVLKKEAVSDFVKAIESDGPSHEWGGPPVVIGEGDIPLEDDLRTYAKGYNGFIVLVDDQALNGEFTNIEQFCIEHYLDYDRQSDARDEHDAQLVEYRTGNPSVSRVSYATQSGQRLVAIEEIEAIVDECDVDTGLVKTLNELNAFLADVDSMRKFEIK